MSHNHNHNHNGRHVDDDDIYYNGVSASSAPSTPPSSTCQYPTPGPPPFDIIQSPFFEGSDPLYKIHPKTLAHMNEGRFFDRASDDDVHMNADAEGYPFATKSYQNYAPDSSSGGSGQPVYTHTTITKSHTAVYNAPRADVDGLETLDAPAPAPEPAPFVFRSKTHPYSPRLATMTLTMPEWLRDLCHYAYHLQLNSVHAMLFILALMVAYQILINDSFRHHRHRVYDDDLHHHIVVTPPIYDQQWFSEWWHSQKVQLRDQLNASLGNQVEALREQVDDVQTHQQTLSTWREQQEQLQQQRDADDARDTEKTADEEDAQRRWFEYHSTINYIAGIHETPALIPFDLESSENNENENECSESEPESEMNTIDWFARNLQTGVKSFADRHFDLFAPQSKQQVCVEFARTNVATSDSPSTLNPDDCLQFEVGDDWIELRLSQPIKPTHFEYIHMDKHKMAPVDRNKSPKRFALFGKRSKHDFDWKPISVKPDQQEILQLEQNSIRLELLAEEWVQFIRVEYETNDDAELTRLYRFRIECHSPDCMK